MSSAVQMKNKDTKGEKFRNSQHALKGPKEDNSQIGSQLSSSSFFLFLMQSIQQFSAAASFRCLNGPWTFILRKKSEDMCHHVPYFQLLSRPLLSPMCAKTPTAWFNSLRSCKLLSTRHNSCYKSRGKMKLYLKRSNDLLQLDCCSPLLVDWKVSKRSHILLYYITPISGIKA